MMNRSQAGFRRYAAGLGLTSLTAAMLLTSGCSRDGNRVTGIDSPAGPVFIRQSGMLGPSGATSPLSVSRYLKAKDGGELDVQGVKVRFDKYSLPADTTVTLTLLDPEALSFRIEPAGLVMNVPATIKTDKLNQTNGRARQDIQVMRKSSQSWQVVDTRLDGNKVEADITVLGDYGLGVTADNGSTVELIRWLDGASFQTRLIAADKGGSVKFGRYKITVPAGALSSDTYITVRDPGAGYLMCDLEPEGTRFSTPAELEVDLMNTGITGSGWSIFWWNPLTDLWQDQHGTFSGDKVTANLAHFSKYAPGKAGW